MELSAVSNIGSQPAFLAGRGNRARKIARKIEQRLPEIQRRRAQREAWNTRQRFFDMKNNETTTAKAATAATASAVGAITAKNNSLPQNPTAEITNPQYNVTRPLKTKSQPKSEVVFNAEPKAVPTINIANKHLKHTKEFNVLKAFDYLRTGPFNGIEEYKQSGEELISILRTTYNFPAFNSLKYQEKLANKILSSDVLVNNQSIRNRLFMIATDDYIWETPKDQSGKEKLTAELEEMTDARIKFLDMYAKDKKMQEDKEIHDEIGYLVQSIQTMEDCDFIIEVLKDSEGKYKTTKENSTRLSPFYSKLGAFIHYRDIPIYITRKILQSPTLENLLGYVSVSSIIKNNKSNAEKLNQVLDVIVENSETVQKMHESGRINHMTLIWAFEDNNDPVKLISEKISAYSRNPW